MAKKNLPLADENLFWESFQQAQMGYSEFFRFSLKALEQSEAKAFPRERHSLEAAGRISDWYDAWIRFTWKLVLAEQGFIFQELKASTAQELAYSKKAIEQKSKQVEKLTLYLFDETGEKRPMEEAEYSYYHNNLNDLTRDLEDERKRFKQLEEIHPLLILPNPPQLNENAVSLFARGGYGRRELTFTSDLDLGYAVDPALVNPLELRLIQEILKHTEERLRGLNHDFASQYFEIGEDLTRFQETAALHTIPSILEARLILGSAELLGKLKTAIRAITPGEKMIRFLENQRRKIPQGPNNELEIKEGFGGIRHLQYALWLLLLFDDAPSASSPDLIRFASEKGMIGEVDRVNLEQALEFYISLRNLIGLFDYFVKELQQQGIPSLIGYHPQGRNFLDDQLSMAYLKISGRFTTVDELDRFRLFSMRMVERLSEAIFKEALNRHVVEPKEGFCLIRHLGTHEIRGVISPTDSLAAETKEILHSTLLHRERGGHLEEVERFFLDDRRFMSLFLSIAQNGTSLSQGYLDAFSLLLPRLEAHWQMVGVDQAKDFIFRLFAAENASAAVDQMMRIAGPLDYNGGFRSLLGIFLPEADQMRLLLRNIKVHQYPLCEHSLKALAQVERELARLQSKEPELWRYLGEQDLFALKWSTFFHDIGKTNPYRDHEELGPVISTKMLMRLGWDENHETLDVIRLLIRHHQSVVRYSQLATHMDLGILRFINLAERSPRQMLLLYLVNVSDYKSVNQMMEERAANLERFFEKTMGALQQFRTESESLSSTINLYLDGKLQEARLHLRYNLLFEQCGLIGLHKALVEPLATMDGALAEKVKKSVESLALAARNNTKGDLNEEETQRAGQKFRYALGGLLKPEHLEALLKPFLVNESWFFSAMPNRYLLNLNSDQLPKLLHHFSDYRQQEIKFYFEKGQKGEMDSLLFSCLHDEQAQSKIAYLLGRMGMNLENGKINQVLYQDGTRGWAGYYQVTHRQKGMHLNEAELEQQLKNLVLPELNFHDGNKEARNIQIQFLPDEHKPYLVEEVEANRFEKKTRKMVALKVSLYDEPFYYFKMMRALHSLDVHPQQVAITTIGRQIIDYFYINEEEQEKLQGQDFVRYLQDFLHLEIR